LTAAKKSARATAGESTLNATAATSAGRANLIQAILVVLEHARP
jgi:hypothetical protein